MRFSKAFQNIFVFLSRFLNYTFFGSNRPFFSAEPLAFEEVIIPSSRDIDGPLGIGNRDLVKIKLIMGINRLLIAICGLCFLVILIYPFVFPDKSVPDTIQNAFYATLGWFGGALGAFFQESQG
jgi:hypothetical protein